MWWNKQNAQHDMQKHSLAAVSETISLRSSNPVNPSASSQLDRMLKDITSDISYMTQTERERVKAQLAAQAREWCVQDISHDLRTPLNAIIGFTQMMESGVLGPVGNAQYLEYLRHIRESGYELLGKVEDLIDTVAPESLKQERDRRHAFA